VVVRLYLHPPESKLVNEIYSVYHVCKVAHGQLIVVNIIDKHITCVTINVKRNMYVNSGLCGSIICVHCVFKRGSYSGNTLAFQAKARGSIPLPRSKG